MALILDGTNGLSDVDGSAATPAIRGSDTNTGIFFPAADTIAFAEGGVESMRLDSAGNVGIGTNAPAYPLDIQADGGAFGWNIRGRTLDGISVGRFANNANTESVRLVAFSNGDFTISNTSSTTERMRINSSGNLLVGRTTSVGDWRLQAEGAGSSGSYSAFFGNANTNTNGIYIGLGGNRSSDATNIQIACFDDVAARMIVRANGNVQNTNNSYGSLSDIKLKENIVDATSKLEKLNQVRVVNYNLIGEEQKQIGVIAQELEQIFPGMVEETPDRDKDGNDLGTTTKSVKYSVFVPMLIKAMQEQQAIITALTARVEALEGAQA